MKLRAECRDCGWIYKDNIGMGIHRTPIYCFICGGRMWVKRVERDNEKDKEDLD